MTNQRDLETMEWAPVKTIIIVEGWNRELDFRWWDEQGKLQAAWLIVESGTSARELREIKEQAVLSGVPFWFADWTYYSRCTKCDQTPESPVRQKYCGRGDDKDNTHQYESIQQPMLDGKLWREMPEEISSRLLAEFSDIVNKYGPYSDRAEDFLNRVAVSPDLAGKCKTVQLLHKALGEEDQAFFDALRHSCAEEAEAWPYPDHTQRKD